MNHHPWPTPPWIELAREADAAAGPVTRPGCFRGALRQFRGLAHADEPTREPA